MNILVTGAKGFVGKNLCAALKNIRDGKDRTRNIKIDEIFEYDIDTEKSLLDGFCENSDFVFNLAGVNRPKETAEFMQPPSLCRAISGLQASYWKPLKSTTINAR